MMRLNNYDIVAIRTGSATNVKAVLINFTLSTFSFDTQLNDTFLNLIRNEFAHFTYS